MTRAARRGLALAGMLLTVLLPAAMAGELPRVFLTPGERAALTTDRLAGRTPAAAPSQADAAADAGRQAAASPGPASADATRRPVRVDGVTFGVDRQQAVWIGGRRIADGASWAGHRVHVMRDGVRLVAADGSVRLLRVGMEVPP